MSPSVSCKMRGHFVSFPALVALEWSLPSVRLHVSLHAARRSTFKLVTNNKIAMSSQEVFARVIKWARYSPKSSISAVELIFIVRFFKIEKKNSLI